MKTLLLVLSFAILPVFAQDYKVEPIASPAPALAPAMQDQGYRISSPSGPWCEVWFAKSIPVGGKPSDDAVVFGIAQGTLLGVVRFPGKGADRRGQVIPAGVYTLRYSNFPADGAHQGAAPQRDFALMSPAAADSDPSAKPDFAALVQMSIKASGTAHPAVLSLEPPPSGAAPASLTKEGEHDWTLAVKAGDLSFAIILVGRAEG
jgi:hypothetical protein